MPVVRFGAVPHRRRCSPNMDRDEWVDDGMLTNATNALFEQRFRDLEANPHASVPWEAAKIRLMASVRHYGVECPSRYRQAG